LRTRVVDLSMMRLIGLMHGKCSWCFIISGKIQWVAMGRMWNPLRNAASIGSEGDRNLE
jgi:hypothetical protein